MEKTETTLDIICIGLSILIGVGVGASGASLPLALGIIFSFATHSALRSLRVSLGDKDEIHKLRRLVEAAVDQEILTPRGFEGNGQSIALLPGEWEGVIKRAIE